MEEDPRLVAQLKSLGKKMFQFRDLVAKIEVPGVMPAPPHDRLFWDMFVKKCSSAVIVLKQIQSALTPDMYHLSVYPGEKIWKNPAAVPDLLSVPDLVEPAVAEPIAISRTEVNAWNSALEEANSFLESYLNSQRWPASRPQTRILPISSNVNEEVLDQRISRLLSTTSRSRAAEDVSSP